MFLSGSSHPMVLPVLSWFLPSKVSLGARPCSGGNSQRVFPRQSANSVLSAPYRTVLVGATTPKYAAVYFLASARPVAFTVVTASHCHGHFRSIVMSAVLFREAQVHPVVRRAWLLVHIPNM